MKLHEAQIANRSQMYMDSSREAFERGKMRAHGVLELPEYPGGGSTPCLTRCRCEWIYEEVYEGDELGGGPFELIGLHVIGVAAQPFLQGLVSGIRSG